MNISYEIVDAARILTGGDDKDKRILEFHDIFRLGSIELNDKTLSVSFVGLIDPITLRFEFYLVNRFVVSSDSMNTDFVLSEIGLSHSTAPDDPSIIFFEERNGEEDALIFVSSDNRFIKVSSQIANINIIQ